MGSECGLGRLEGLQQRQNLFARTLPEQDQNGRATGLSVERKKHVVGGRRHNERSAFAHGDVLRLEGHSAAAFNSVREHGKQACLRSR